MICIPLRYCNKTLENSTWNIFMNPSQYACKWNRESLKNSIKVFQTKQKREKYCF